MDKFKQKGNCSVFWVCLICLLFSTTFLSAQNTETDAINAQEAYLNEKIDTVKPQYVALKTNLFYDAALLPNITAEWYIGKQWSLAVEGNWNWWTFGNPVQNHTHYRIQAAGIELRRWLNSPNPLQGHALGVYSMIGNYDIRFSPENEKSAGYLSYLSWSAGLSYAYSIPIARRFNLELGLAMGYIGGRYYKYDYCMMHQQWEQQAIYNRKYFGPTRIGVSLVWQLGRDNGYSSKSYKKTVTIESQNYQMKNQEFDSDYKFFQLKKRSEELQQRLQESEQ